MKNKVENNVINFNDIQNSVYITKKPVENRLKRL